MASSSSSFNERAESHMLGIPQRVPVGVRVIHLYQKQTLCFITRHIKIIWTKKTLRCFVLDTFGRKIQYPFIKWFRTINGYMCRIDHRYEHHAIKWNKNNKNWNWQHLTRAHFKCSSLFSVCLFIGAVLFTFRLRLSVFFGERKKRRRRRHMYNTVFNTFHFVCKQNNSIVVWWTIVLWKKNTNKTKTKQNGKKNMVTAWNDCCASSKTWKCVNSLSPND